MPEYASKSEIDALDQLIDRRIPHFPLLARQKDQALFHLLLQFEQYIEIIGQLTDLNVRRNRYRNLYNGLNHAVQWIYRFCPRPAQNSQPQFNRDTFLEADDLLVGAATDYAVLWAQLSLLQRNRNRCRKLGPDFYQISSASLQDQEMEAARQMILSADEPIKFEDASILSRRDVTYISKNIKINRRSDDGLKYSFAPTVFSHINNGLKSKKMFAWSMDPSWDLGGYTYQQLRQFWSALQALCLIHELALAKITNEKKRYLFRIKQQNFEEWTRELSQRSQLPAKITRQIINDLIYDPELYQPGKAKAHVMYQPFFRFDNGKLGASNKIVQISRIDRNAWTLLSIIRPERHSELRNYKEKFWIDSIEKNILPLKLDCFPQINFKFENKPGDIDLLIMDPNSRFGLVCQLKWLTSTDDVKGVASDDKQIGEGIEQAARSLRWVRSSLDVLAQRIQINLDDLRQYEFQPLVISKDSLASGYLDNDAIPVISQDLFDWVLGKPHHRDLQALWQVARSKSYLPKRGVHFQTIAVPLKWGELEFSLEAIGFKLIKRWEPENDIFE